MNNKKVSQYGLLIALAFLLSYIECLIPFPMLVPGMKVGLANIVIIFAMYVMNAKSAAILSLIRILLVSFTFGNLYSLMYSVAGAVLSLLIMILLKKMQSFSVIGVSLAGAVMHNIGQVIVAAVTIDSVDIMYILPILTIVAVVTGIVIGLVSSIVIKRLQTYV